MKLEKDIAIKHDFIINKGSSVDVIPNDEGIVANNDLVEVSLKRNYTFRGVVIETGSVIQIGESRALQLAQGGYLLNEVIDNGITERHREKAQRKSKETPPTIVEHKIKE